MKVAQFRQDFKYLMVQKDGGFEGKSQAGFLDEDDVCLMESNEQDMQTICDSIVVVLKSMTCKLIGKRWFVLME